MPDREDYRRISISPILSKVYEKLVSYKLSSFGEKYISCLLLSLLVGKVWVALMPANYSTSHSEVLRYRDGVLMSYPAD